MKPHKAQIQHQYQNLKHKVQSQIQALQKKLSHNTQIHYHRTINPTNPTKTLLEPSTSSEYHHTNNKHTTNHQHSYHHHQHNCHNHSVHSAHSCCHSHSGHCGQCRSRKSSLSMQDDATPVVSRTINSHVPVSTLLQPPPYPQVNVPLVNTKILEHNLFLQQAFIKSMQTQQQMAQNMRLLQQKIAKLEQHPQSTLRTANNSQNSQNQYQFRTQSSCSDQARSRSLKHNNYKYRTNYERQQRTGANGNGYNVVLNEYSRGRWENYESDDGEHEERAIDNSKSNRSGERNGSRRSNAKSSHSIKSNRNETSGKKVQSSKNISSSSKNIKPSLSSQNHLNKLVINPSSHNNNNNEYLLHPNNHKHLLSPKSPNHIQKSPNAKLLLIKKQQWSDYYTADRLCPVHINPAQIRLKSKDKQVYVDSQHRNRKHQRDHLVESFKQQDIARKKLMEKILKSSSGITINLMNK